jgi:hypothetical protein
MSRSFDRVAIEINVLLFLSYFSTTGILDRRQCSHVCPTLSRRLVGCEAVHRTTAAPVRISGGTTTYDVMTHSHGRNLTVAGRFRAVPFRK